MSPVQAAARAVNHEVWPESLQTLKCDGMAGGASGPLIGDFGPHILRDVYCRLLAGLKWLERKRAQQLSCRRLRVAETISLGEKRSVSIIEVDGEQFLIGSSAGNVQLLAVLDKTKHGEVLHRPEIARTS